MKKFALFFIITIAVFGGVKFIRVSSADKVVTDCSRISGYRLTQGETCQTAVDTPVVFNFRVKDPDNNNLTWSIDYGDDKGGGFNFSCPSFQSNNTLSVSHIWSKSGTYKVKLGVSNCKGGEAYASFNIIVNVPAIFASLQAVPSSLGYGGGPATIFVSTAGATSCYIPITPDMKSYSDKSKINQINQLGSFQGQGRFNQSYISSFKEVISFEYDPNNAQKRSAGNDASIEVSPTIPTTYSISCIGPGGTVNNSVKIAVDTDAPPTAKISISPSIIPFGSSATLAWSSTNSQYCKASEGNYYSTSLWKGKKDLSGTVKIDNFNSIDGSGGFTITCFNSAGKSAQASAGWTGASSLPTNDAYGLNAVFKLSYGNTPSVYLTWNSTLPLGYKGGYKIWRSDFGLVGVIRTDLTGETTSLIDTRNINCPSTHIYKVIPFRYDSNFNLIDDSNNASKPFVHIVKYPCN